MDVERKRVTKQSHFTFYCRLSIVSQLLAYGRWHCDVRCEMGFLFDRLGQAVIESQLHL